MPAPSNPSGTCLAIIPALKLSDWGLKPAAITFRQLKLIWPLRIGDSPSPLGFLFKQTLAVTSLKSFSRTTRTWRVSRRSHLSPPAFVIDRIFVHPCAAWLNHAKQSEFILDSSRPGIVC